VSASAIGFAGLTHLGLCSAVAAASKGFRVVGYDSDSARVKEVAEGRWPVLEPGLVELAGTQGARLAWRDDIGALGLCDVVYIASDVPNAKSPGFNAACAQGCYGDQPLIGFDNYGFDISTNEFPLFIPISSHWKDSAGHGKYRGGVGTAQLWVAHHVPMVFMMAIADNSKIPTPQG